MVLDYLLYLCHRQIVFYFSEGLTMNIYLAIITTVLVITQIIRVCQNHIQLRRQHILFKKQLGQLADCEPTKEDFEIQRKAYRLVVKHLQQPVEGE
jgi:hypothetical protein